MSLLNASDNAPSQSPFYEKLIQNGLVPDWFIRIAIRKLFSDRYNADKIDSGVFLQQQMEFIHQTPNQPLVIAPESANEQHYEVPTAFFLPVLGARMKYSACMWESTVNASFSGDKLDAAEEKMLALTCARARIDKNSHILELGCGWGSFSLYVAEKFPTAQITAVSNSQTQREYIESQVKKKRLKNLQVFTMDVQHIDSAPFKNERFSHVVSIEMFEHFRNYKLLLEKISLFLEPKGLLFVHIFTTMGLPYYFESNNWMARYFFTGGTMPSDNLLLYFQDHVQLLEHWRVNGMHYQKTLEAWLARMDANKILLWPVLEATYGKKDAKKWWNYWRIFFMACSELFGFRNGNHWLVSHYLFQKRA